MADKGNHREEKNRTWRPGQERHSQVSTVSLINGNTNNPVRRLRIILILIGFLIVMGTSGYRLIEGWSWRESLFMTMITLSTVGYQEVHPLSANGEVFSIVLIGVGVVLVAMLVSSGVQLAVSEQIRNILGRRRMERELNKIRDHEIICGFGRMGQQIVREFRRYNVPHVVIEDNPDQLPRLNEWKVPHVIGDATEDDVLIQAGVLRAKGLVAVASTDADNIFITLSARGLNPKLRIVARSMREEDEEKLRRAGADKVLSPYIIGGRRMAAAVMNPEVVEFLDLAMHSGNLDLELGEIPVSSQAPFTGKPIHECGIRENTQCQVVALKKKGELFSTPNPQMILEEGDILIIIGNAEQLEAMRRWAQI